MKQPLSLKAAMLISSGWLCIRYQVLYTIAFIKPSESEWKPTTNMVSGAKKYWTIKSYAMTNSLKIAITCYSALDTSDQFV